MHTALFFSERTKKKKQHRETQTQTQTQTLTHHPNRRGTAQYNHNNTRNPTRNTPHTHHTLRSGRVIVIMVHVIVLIASSKIRKGSAFEGILQEGVSRHMSQKVSALGKLQGIRENNTEDIHTGNDQMSSFGYSSGAWPNRSRMR